MTDTYSGDTYGEAEQDAPAPAWVDGFLAGDETAFTRLWDHYAPQILREIRRFTTEYDEIEDLLQHIRIALYRSRTAYVPTRRIGAWIYGVCHNQCLWWQRSQQRLQRGLSECDWGIDRAVELESEIEAEAQDYELLCHRVKDAVDRLPPRQRAIVLLRTVHGQPVAQVAAQLHCAPGTVKSAQHTALRHVRHFLGLSAESSDPDSSVPDVKCPRE